ncbi:MAG TPA: membrane protein insertase YidC [Candidatus Binatia bacterium]|jgi:YidC/Oxa1 family membrane protein insertase
MEQRRALIAAALCLAILLVYQEAIRRLYPPPPPGTPGEVSENADQPASPPGAEEQPGAAADVQHPAAAAVATIVTVETELYTARVSSAGGRLVSLRLKRFRTTIDPASEPLEMVDVMPGAAPPLGLRMIADNGKVEDDTDVAYAPDQSQIELSGPDTATLTLRGTLPSGTAIEKKLAFTGNAYPITLEVRAAELPAHVTRIGVGWRRHVLATNPKDPDNRYRSAVLLQSNKLVHETPVVAPGPPPAPKQFDAPVAWAGYADHYFLAAIAPEDPATGAAAVGGEHDGVQILLTAPRAADGARFTLYVGPKDVDVLEHADHQFARAVEFGWFSFLAVPLLRLLNLFHGVTRNYGIDIILLTLLVKGLFLPLSQKSMKSMRDMQRLQPQVAKLREKFKDDRERLNKEMMELYRRHRVNPLGGCLPMVLQLPVFVGLYQSLGQAIELRHAKFAFWVRDLSAHECYPWPGQAPSVGCNEFALFGVPIPILVLFMGASMLLQQYLSPSSGMDPAQQRMMMVVMPVMFTVMFVSFPSGLVLYWLVNNLLTIGQQWWTNRSAVA